ncbi:MAG: PD40 domain-containing protein, partial [Proteobacteria bacterium]|nr:PD40 domain-containing protein [Pseudomonadota bacterium]
MHPLVPRVTALVLGALLVAAAGAEAPARRPLVPADFYAFQTVSDPQVAPGGDWVAYVVTVNDRESDEQKSALWMASWDGREHVALTRPASGTHAPRWSPDGRYLAFVATPAGGDKAQLMLLDRRGGEPQPLTSLAGDLGAYAWSPDGRRLVLAVAEADDDPPETAPHPAAAKPPRPRPIVIDALHFKQDEEGYLATGHSRHLYLLDLESRSLAALTAGPGVDDDVPAWSPDGARIAFTRLRDKSPDAEGRVELAVVEARAGAAARTIARPHVPND